MRILLTNDDGVNAPGLRRLAARLGEHHDITVYAPQENRSGASHSITLRKPVRIVAESERVHAVAGTPADCVYVALSLNEDPDLIISGINAGPNLGCDTLYSGTVAAAMESRFIARPSLAVSLCCPPGSRADHDEYETACDVVERMLEQRQLWQELGAPVININVPQLPTAQLQGWRWCRLGHRQRPLPAEPCEDVDNAWTIGMVGPPATAAYDTDFDAINDGCVALTPLHADLTAHDVLAAAPEMA